MKYIYPSTLSGDVAVVGNNAYGCEIYIYNASSSTVKFGFATGGASGSGQSTDHQLQSKKMLHAILVDSSIGWYIQDM